MTEPQIALALELLRSLVALPPHQRSIEEAVRLLALPYHQQGLRLPAARSTMHKWARFGIYLPAYPQLKRPFLELCRDVDDGKLSLSDLCLARSVAAESSMVALQHSVDIAQALMLAPDYAKRTTPRDHTSLMGALTKAAAQLTPKPAKGQRMTDEELLEKCVALVAAAPEAVVALLGVTERLMLALELAKVGARAPE